MENTFDLSLVPFDVLIKEAESRCPTFCAAYTKLGPEGKGQDYFWLGKGSRSKSISLASDLLNDILNDWSGELRTLKRLNNEEIDEHE